MPLPSARWNRTGPSPTRSVGHLLPLSDRSPADAHCDRLPLARHVPSLRSTGFLEETHDTIHCLQESLVFGMMTMVLVAQAPLPGYTEELSTQSDEAIIPELQLIKEEESVSIASRYEQPISQVPSNVYVITDEDIRQSGATDLPTVLRRIPGLEVMQTTGAELNVSLRGDNQLTANKLLVMADGRSIYVDSQGLVFWKAIPVTLPEIKRIEVLKGAASVLYGFNAFDGIINIITKSPEEMKGTTLQFGGGSYGTISSAAIRADTVDKFGYRLPVGHDQNQEWRNSDALAFRSNKYNGQTTYALSGESKLLVSGGLVDVNRYDGPISGNLSGAYRFWKEKTAAGYIRKAEVAISALNALADRHKEHPLGDTIGSRVMGWLTVRCSMTSMVVL